MEEELEIINNIKKDINVKENLEFLIKIHGGIFKDVLDSYLVKEIDGLTKLDIIKQRLNIFWRAAIEFNINKEVKFSTWLGRATFFFLSREYNKVKHFKNSIPITDNFNNQTLFSTDIFYKDYYRENEIEEILKIIWKEIKLIKDKRVIKIFKLRYLETTNHKLKPWREIGESLGLTRQTCLNIHNNTIKKIKKKIKNEQKNSI